MPKNNAQFSTWFKFSQSILVHFMIVTHFYCILESFMKYSIVGQLLVGFLFLLAPVISYKAPFHGNSLIRKVNKVLVSSFISTGFLFGQPNLAYSLTIPLDPNPTFSVEKASVNDIKALDVSTWSTWSSAENPKYAVNKLKSKEYEVNEVCYIDKGKFEITPGNGATATTVQAGDFVVFPKNFKCTWEVIEPVSKHWLEY